VYQYRRLKKRVQHARRSFHRVLRNLSDSTKVLLNCPNFLVRQELGEAGGSHPAQGRAPSQIIGFRLRPTTSFWAWNLFSLAICSFSLAEHWAWAALGSGLSALWVLALLRRLIDPNRAIARLSSSPQLLRHTPFLAQRRSAIVWLLAATVSTLFATLCLVATLGRVERYDRLFGATEFLAIGGVLLLVYLLIYRVWPRLLSVPGLYEWYKALPSPVQPMVRRATESGRIVPSMTWRHIADVSREVHQAGIALTLFDSNAYRPIWRRNALCFFWYFAPILLPAITLFLAPTVFNIARGLPGIDNESKLLYGLASITWAAWSVSYFFAIGSRDFGETPTYPAGYSRGLLADTIAYPNKATRSVAADFFQGSGSTAIQLISVALVPAFAGYLGLFGEYEQGTSKGAPTAQQSTTAQKADAIGAGRQETKSVANTATATKTSLGSTDSSTARIDYTSPPLIDCTLAFQSPEILSRPSINTLGSSESQTSSVGQPPGLEEDNSNRSSLKTTRCRPGEKAKSVPNHGSASTAR